MGATFPNGIAEFTQKRNLFDDVDANDINRLQDEVRAIQATLGPLLNSFTQLVSDVDNLQEEQEQDNLREVQEDIVFRSMAEQLAYLHRGYQHDCVTLTPANSLTVPPTKTLPGAAKPSTVIKMQKPAVQQDPAKMYQTKTGGITLRKSGFYIIHGHVRYDIKNANGNNNAGVYDAGLEVGGQWFRGFDRREALKDSVWTNLILNPVVMGWFNKGTNVNLRTAHYSKVNQIVPGAHLSAALIRQAGSL